MPIKRLPNEISAADSSRVNLSTSEMVPGLPRTPLPERQMAAGAELDHVRESALTKLMHQAAHDSCGHSRTGNWAAWMTMSGPWRVSFAFNNDFIRSRTTDRFSAGDGVIQNQSERSAKVFDINLRRSVVGVVVVRGESAESGE